MTRKAVSVNRHRFTLQDQLFLDANIWLYIYCPQSPTASSNVRTYSQVFKRILSAKSRVYVDVLVISEFINRYARTQWQLIASHIEQFKDFRNSSYFQPIAQDITNDVKRILKHCSRIESGFETLGIRDLLDQYATGSSDFNDQVIVELCKREGLTLITNDGDFRGQEIPVLTANQRLLS